MAKSVAFKNSEQIQAAEKNAPAIGWGAKGTGVAIIQGVLVELGARMPKTMVKGTPDGIFGNETYDAIVSFQRSNPPLVPDGWAGRNTIAALDRKAFAMESNERIKFKRSPDWLPGQYELGTTQPVVKRDAGAGKFSSSKPTYQFQVYKKTLLTVLPYYQGQFGKEASEMMMHFLYASGIPKNINLRNMVHAGPNDASNSPLYGYYNEVVQAQRFASSLPEGTHAIRSTKPHITTANYGSWYYAVNGMQVWGMAEVTITRQNNGMRHYKMRFDYHMFDRYNWDLGNKAITIDPSDYGAPNQVGTVSVDDSTVGEFVRQGLAREFDVFGKFTETIEWNDGDLLAPKQVPLPKKW